MSALWTPETGGHNDLHPFPPRRRNTSSHPPMSNLPTRNNATQPPNSSTSSNPSSSNNPSKNNANASASQTNTNTNGANTNEEDEPLFPPSLLPRSTLDALPQGYTMRPLTIADYARGHLETLKALTSVGEVGREQWVKRWRWMKRRNDDNDEGGKGDYFVIVVCDGTGKVVGTGTVVVERKFIHDLGSVSHIEDIVVRKDQQGKKLGLRIIEALDHVSKEVGCYKAILDCSDTNEGFYVKCGYERKGLQMAHYYDK